jgi:hypothetical protein
MTSGSSTQDILDLIDDAIKIGADAVEFVDENQAGDAGVIGITPVGLGLGLDAPRAAEDADATIEHLERAVDLDGEIHVARGVDDIQPTTLPLTGGSSGLNGDAALRLLLHEVHGGLAVMHLTQAMDLARQLENPLGRRRLTRIHVGKNTDVSVM